MGFHRFLECRQLFVFVDAMQQGSGSWIGDVLEEICNTVELLLLLPTFLARCLGIAFDLAGGAIDEDRGQASLAVRARAIFQFPLRPRKVESSIRFAVAV